MESSLYSFCRTSGLFLHPSCNQRSKERDWERTENSLSWTREEMSTAFSSSSPLALAPRTTGSSFSPSYTSRITACFPPGLSLALSSQCGCLRSRPVHCSLPVHELAAFGHPLGDAALDACKSSFVQWQNLSLCPFLIFAMLLKCSPTQHTYALCLTGFLSHTKKISIALKAAKLPFFFF